MEVTFSELKQKEVINLCDGKHLGRVCDIAFNFPEGKISGFSVTGGKGFRFTRQEIFLPLKSVVKIGEDAVLVNFGENPPPPPPPPKKAPDYCPPPKNNCTPPDFFPPKNNCPPPDFCPPSRRSLDEYE